MSTLRYWVWLSALTGLKPKTKFDLLNAFGDPDKIYFADEKQLYAYMNLSDSERSQVLNKSIDRTNEILEKCQSEGISIVTIQDVFYPNRLKNTYDPPIVLYIKGKLPAIDDEAAIGIVGTREATTYGIKMAKKISFDITKGGGLVVTGLAEGIDTAAAEGALLAGGSCLGVLGCAIDDVFPKSNASLFSDIASVGALVSEYPPGNPIYRKNFPERNRIISGLSVGVTVIEAPLKSGALITAAYALDQGREVFAVPGNADAANWYGSNELIKNGAQLITKGWDVLEGFNQLFSGKLSKPDTQKTALFSQEEQRKSEDLNTNNGQSVVDINSETGKDFAKLKVRNDRKRIDNTKKREYIDLREQLTGLNEKQLKIVSVMSEKSMHIDDIIDHSGLEAHVVLSELTILQIKGYVTQETGKRFTLNIKLR